MYTDLLADLIAGGEDPTASAAAAVKACEGQASADAIDAAFTAADASSIWIQVLPYGSSAAPKIAPGGAAMAAVHFDNDQFTGGWKFSGIDIANAKAAGIDAEKRVGFANGLWIEDCTCTNITGVPTSPIANPPGFNVFCGTGIMTFSVKYVIIRNATISGCGMPVFLTAHSNAEVDNLQASDCLNEGLWSSVRLATSNYAIGGLGVYTVPQHVLIKNSTLTNMGTPDGMSFGVAGIQINGGEDVMIHDTTVTGTGVGADVGVQDRVGIDLEGYGSRDVQIARCNVSSNGGAAMLWFHHFEGSGFDNERSQILDSTFANNDLSFFAPATAQFMRLYDNIDNFAVINGNTFTRTAPTQKINWVEDDSGDPQGFQDTWPTRFLVGLNTITP